MYLTILYQRERCREVKNKRRFIILLVAILIISSMLVSCGDKPEEVSDAPKEDGQAKQDGQTEKEDKPEKKEKSETANTESELRIMWWGSQDRHDKTLKVIEMFEDENPGITMEPEYSGWDGYWEKIAAQAAANNLPDIMQHDYQYLMQYTQKGLIVDLDPYVEDGTLNLDDVDENSIIGGKVDGKLYAVNIGTNSPAVAYDPEMFKRAGVPEPSSDWTWEDYMETVTKLNKELGVYGDGGMAITYFHELKHYIRQNGEKFYSEDNTELGYTDDKLFEDHFNRQLQLVNTGIMPSPDIRLEIKSIEDELIVEEKAAMCTIHSNQILAMIEAANRPLKLALLPKMEGQKQEGQYLKPGQFLAVTTSSKNPDIAVKFVDYFTNDIEANKVLMAERGVPISAKVREALFPMLNDGQKEMFNYIELAAEHSDPIDPPEPAGHPEVEKSLKSLGDKILFGEITPEDAAKKFREEANQILKRAAK